MYKSFNKSRSPSSSQLVSGLVPAPIPSISNPSKKFFNLIFGFAAQCEAVKPKVKIEDYFDELDGEERG